MESNIVLEVGGNYVDTKSKKIFEVETIFVNIEGGKPKTMAIINSAAIDNSNGKEITEVNTSFTKNLIRIN